MRTVWKKRLSRRQIATVLFVLVGAFLVSACPHRQDDGLVFDETATNKSKKKRAKVAKSGDLMYGRVVDRNDQPLKRVTILVSPGNGELITNKWGEYEIDRLHADDGSPIPLEPGTDYTINAWKPGYHETTQIFRFDGGVQEIPTITLIEDSIKLEDYEPVPLVPQDEDDGAQTGTGVSVENE